MADNSNQGGYNWQQNPMFGTMQTDLQGLKSDATSGNQNFWSDYSTAQNNLNSLYNNWTSTTGWSPPNSPDQLLSHAWNPNQQSPWGQWGQQQGQGGQWGQGQGHGQGQGQGQHQGQHHNPMMFMIQMMRYLPYLYGQNGGAPKPS